MGSSGIYVSGWTGCLPIKRAYVALVTTGAQIAICRERCQLCLQER
jgi:hypothetical protein